MSRSSGFHGWDLQGVGLSQDLFVGILIHNLLRFLGLGTRHKAQIFYGFWIHARWPPAQAQKVEPPSDTLRPKL